MIYPPHDKLDTFSKTFICLGVALAVGAEIIWLSVLGTIAARIGLKAIVWACDLLGIPL